VAKNVNKDVNTPLIDSERLGRSIMRVLYDRVEDGVREVMISTDSIRDYDALKDNLESLERTWYLVSTNETVTDLDYWQGFFRTSANL